MRLIGKIFYGIALLCAFLCLYLSTIPYLGDYLHCANLVPSRTVAVCVFLLGVACTFLAKRWGNVSRQFIWAVSLVLWASFLLFLVATIFFKYHGQHEKMTLYTLRPSRINHWQTAVCLL
jgi:hypothetical protein